MAYTPTNWEDLPSTNTPINATNLNKIENGLVKKKYQDFTFNITPSTDRGGAGYGETTLDISSLNATKILGYCFHTTSTFLLWGVTTDITNNPQTLGIYGYRLAGTYTTAINARIRVYYED